MPRHARIVAAGFPMHAILRGIDRAVIFFHDSDYRVLLDVLAERAAAESVRIHAYVLMTNHLHLLMTPETERGPSSLMKGLGQRYVQHINRTYRRTGTLFEGRLGLFRLVWVGRQPVGVATVRKPVVVAPQASRARSWASAAQCGQRGDEWGQAGGNSWHIAP